MRFAIIDIETTGGSITKDRITEIALYLHDGEKIVDEFSTLINPECEIPPFISRLTGINNQMVENAPRFFEVAKQIVELTKDSIFVAHNAPFDYGFIKQEFKSLGFNYTKNCLCTVKLSRKIFPGFKSYSLGNLCSSLSINIENRHRAGGDALATVKLFERLIEKNKSDDVFSNYIGSDNSNLRFPPEFNRTIIDKLPETCGVYYLYNENGALIYIGKSNNIRSRILSHFSNKQTKKSNELRNSIRDITFEETGNELIALLLESEEIKKHQPFFNHALRRNVYNHNICLSENENGYLTFRISRSKEQEDSMIISVSTHDQATSIIDTMIDKYNLCQKICGIYDITHACFAYSVNKCNGACIGKENPEIYNERVMQAVGSLKYKNPDFMIIGDGRSFTEKSIVRIEKGKYVGYGYFDTEFVKENPDALKDCIIFKDDNRDISRIIRQYLKHDSNHNLIVY